ncbi:oligo-1,6-glucosidase [Apodospora peruviana]|uniref:Oligo-1,6-glucosidase n=1 Tax=Apodospora peruviana TaxID=516989 RepID=A0AAE0HUZ1_9PEZI|nr:oligo-1,6-glucosidase [Apodospora peruviana]
MVERSNRTASFQSHPGNTSGWGSVKGITSRLDYLKDLGVNVLWTSSIYKSPQADMGYDIADYEDIDPRYGTPEPPNNWAQILGEANSAWNFEEATGEYYLGPFTPEQPDLNWENPAVHEAVWDIMHFWLNRGVSGFRMDVINLISKDPWYPYAPVILGAGYLYQPGQRFFINGPKLHDYLRDMNSEVLSKHDAIALGEMPDVHDPANAPRAVGARSGELNMIFIFDLVDIDNPNVRMALQPWTVRDMKAIITRWQLETCIWSM